MREKRHVLVDKRDETRRNADTLNIGGGISLWPDMEDMRLSRAESMQSYVFCRFYWLSSLVSPLRLYMVSLYLPLRLYMVSLYLAVSS